MVRRGGQIWCDHSPEGGGGVNHAARIKEEVWGGSSDERKEGQREMMFVMSEEEGQVGKESGGNEGWM